jgi:hypothetical protein
VKTNRTPWSSAIGLSLALAIGLIVFSGVSRSDQVSRKSSWSIPGASSESDLGSTNTPPKSLGKTDSPFRTQFYFERNDGQFDSEVLYASRSAHYSLFLTRSGVTVLLNRNQSRGASVSESESRYFSLRFAGANPAVVATGEELMPGISNYFYSDDPKQWHTRVPQFAKVRYANAYPGIDLVFYFRDGHLEYDAIAAPGADPNVIRFSVEHAKPKLTRAGDVAIEMAAKEVVRLRKPYAYQRNNASSVAAGYSLRGNQLSFKLAKYDATRPLIVDPALIFSTFIVSNCPQCQDSVTDIAADSTGVYLTGKTTASTFPGTTATGSPNSFGVQTFIVKIDPTGAHVLYSTFLPNSQGKTIAVDSHGSAYIGGIATVPATPAFPLTSGVFSGTIPPNASQFGLFGTWGVPFATKLSADGSTLVYSTLLQQPTSNGTAASSPFVVGVTKIAVDSAGALYLTGTTGIYSTTSTSSLWMALPVTTGAYQTTPGSAYLMKLNPTATGLTYATYIDGAQGANNNNMVGGLAVDSSGNAIVAGLTSSSSFPTSSGAYQTTSLSRSGAQIGFVFELDPTGSNRVYSTLFSTPPDPTSGESGVEALTGVAVDSHGQAVIVGSASGTLPVTSNAFCGNSPYSNMGFVAKLKSDGSGIVYASSLCGGDFNQGGSTVGSWGQATSVAVDSSDAVYVAGTIGPPTGFQAALLHPIQSYFASGSSVNMNTAVKLDSVGNLLWSTFLGQNSFGVGFAEGKIAADNSGNAYVLAYSDVPPTEGTFGPSSPQIANEDDMAAGNVLVKIASSLGSPVALLSPRQVSFTNQNTGVASSAVDVQVGNFGDAPMSPMISITGDFSETDTCSAAIPGGAKCDVSVVFTPTTTGPRTGTLTVAFGGTIPSQTVSLSGNAGAPAVMLSPSSLSFGTQSTGTTSPAQQVTVTNNGTGPLMISSAQASAQFAATNTCGAPVAVGNSCTIQVTFTPTGAAVQSGTLTITDNAANSPQTVSLTGNAPPPSLGLGIASGASASATVPAGGSASYSLVIGGQGATGNATLTCTGAPAGAVCSVPATVALSATTPSKITASVTTTARSGLWPVRFPPVTWLWAFAGLGSLIAWRLASRRSSPRLGWSLVPLFALVLCACGGGSNNSSSAEGTQAGSYTLVVTAKVGSTLQTQNLTLSVN